MKFNFKGQTAVVTGGTRGIGRGISEALLKAGVKVIATYQSNDKAAKEFEKSNEEYSDFLDLRSFDVTKYDQVEGFLSLCRADLWRIPDSSSWFRHSYRFCSGYDA